MAEITACSGSMTGLEIADALSKKFAEGITINSASPKKIYSQVDKEIFLELCKFLKNELHFDHTSLVSGVDRIDRIQAVFHITSYINNCCLIEIVVDLDHEKPEIDSVTPLWEGANYHERETYDMMGIVFKGHPDMRRIFLPDDTRFFPQRKDFKLKEVP